jgi:hypothetical protein
MRLPVVTGGAPGAGEAASEQRMCSCGAPLRPGLTLCPICGARHK